MRLEGVAVREGAAALFERRHHTSRHEHRTERQIAGAEALGDGLQIRRHTFLLPGVRRTAAAHATHDLVQDQQRAVAIADLAHRGEVAGLGRHTPGRGAHDGFSNERHHAPRPDALELGVELGGEPRHVLRTRFVRRLVAEGETRRHVAHVRHEQRLVEATPGGMSAHRKRAKGVAVVTLAAGDEVNAVGLADLHEILPRHLHARFDGFRAGRHEVGMRQSARLVAHERVGERLGHLTREERRVHVGERGRLTSDRVHHALLSVPEARHRRAARRIDHGAAIGKRDGDPVAAHGDVEGLSGGSVQDVRHRGSSDERQDTPRRRRGQSSGRARSSACASPCLWA